MVVVIPLDGIPFQFIDKILNLSENCEFITSK